MSASGTAHQKVIDLLAGFTPSPLWEDVYSAHEKANLIVPSLSVEVESDIQLENNGGIINQELVDNRLIQLSIRVHINYRLGPVDTSTGTDTVDVVIRYLRENINLGGGYRIFEVTGIAYNVDHTSSGTTGAEINVNIHKVEFYEQS